MTTGHKESTAKTVRIGVVGFGLRLRQVMSRLLAQAGGRVRIAAVYDPTRSERTEACSLLDADVVFCKTEDELFAFPELDWVFISSPNHLHAAHAVKALDRGLNVFCEKPLATNLEDCLLVRQKVQESGAVFAFGLVLR